MTMLKTNIVGRKEKVCRNLLQTATKPAKLIKTKFIILYFNKLWLKTGVFDASLKTSETITHL